LRRRARAPRTVRARSAGRVPLSWDGLSADGVVRRLRRLNIIGSAAPYATRHVRLTPSMRNTVEDIDYAIGALRRIKEH